MTLWANEYPDIWQFSDEHPSPKHIPIWADSKVRVREFVDVFLQHQFFGKIVIWEHKNWFESRSITEKKESGFCVLDYLPEAELVRHAIESYSLTGHLSVLFAPLESDLFFSKILKTKHYGQACNIEIGTEKPDDPLALRKAVVSLFLNRLFSRITIKFLLFHMTLSIYMKSF